MSAPLGITTTTTHTTTTKDTSMDTTVITVGETDYGVGASDRVTFVDSDFMVDERGDLYVYRKPGGNVGSFPHSTWRAVVRGEVADEAAGRTAVRR
jgi:hypothetical protein